MTTVLKSYGLLIEEDGVVTLPEAAIRHPGCEPGVEIQLKYEVHQDGSIVILPNPNAAAESDVA